MPSPRRARLMRTSAEGYWKYPTVKRSGSWRWRELERHSRLSKPSSGHSDRVPLRDASNWTVRHGRRRRPVKAGHRLPAGEALTGRAD